MNHYKAGSYGSFYLSLKNPGIHLLSIIIVLFVVPSELFSQNNGGKKEIQAYRLNEDDRFVFDGKVTEEFWDQIEPATNFRQQEPNEGDAATERTEVRVAYDDEYLYMGVILYDNNPAGIKATQKRRDARIIADERFTWFFDTFNDNRTAYFMEINPNALRTDGLITTGQGQNINLSWDGIWDAKAGINEQGWMTEVKIPFRTFNFDPNSDTWGVNFMRVIRRKSETVLWTGHLRSQGISRPQDGGILTGLTGMSQGLGLEVVPFGILNGSEVKTETGDETDTDIDGGIDINYSITPSLKASLTFNTDFAEAEVDQRIVNLTRFAVQFPEQRDFFLEGSNIYDFAPASGVNPYFSRRIGLREGQPIPITYGARLLGNTGPYNIAFLHVRTGELGEINPENFLWPGSNEMLAAKARSGLFTPAVQPWMTEMLNLICKTVTHWVRISNWGLPLFLEIKTCSSKAFLYTTILPLQMNQHPIFGIELPVGSV